jgi:hypothetical protein
MQVNTYIASHPNHGAWLANMRENNWTARGRNWLDEAGGVEDFALFLYLADRWCRRISTLGIFDIDDWLWADAFEADRQPKECAIEALQDAGAQVDDSGNWVVG